MELTGCPGLSVRAGENLQAQRGAPVVPAGDTVDVEALPEFAAVQLADQSDLGWPYAAEPLANGRWRVDHWLDDPATWEFRPVPGELLVVDDTLRPVWRLRPPPEPLGWRGTHAVADDLSLAALALPREVRLVDPDDQLVTRWPYPAEHERGYAEFDPDGTLWVQFPGRDEHLQVNADLQVLDRHSRPGLGEAGGCVFTADGRWLWAYVPHTGEGGAVLWLIEVAGRRLVDRHRLDFPAQVVAFHRHPDGQSVCVALSAGAEEHAEYWARPQHGGITLWRTPGLGELTAIHPSGQECLTGPAWQGPEELTRRRWPDGAVLARLSKAAVAPSGGSLGAGQYLTGELLLATVGGLAGGRDGHLLLARASLRPLGWVYYPGYGSLPGTLGPCRDGTWLTLDRGYASNTVRRWTLVDPPAPTADQVG